jgi:hypothetical protein
MIKTFLLFMLLCAAELSKAQAAKNSDLFLTMEKQDSVFFERAFNLCDMEYLD